jgi:ssRNA-specific RNase YbeY (16S rRNA maturation enzyme)
MVEINNTTKQKINLKKTQQLVEEFLKLYSRNNYDVSVAIIGSQKMKSLNYKYRKQNMTTDVLSFSGQSKFLGEIIINISETKKLSKYQTMFQELEIIFSGVKKSKFKKPRVQESKIKEFYSSLCPEVYLFYFLLIHGLLHLVGYNDDTPDKRNEMLKLGRNFLDKML